MADVEFTGKEVYTLIKQFHSEISKIIATNDKPLSNSQMVNIVSKNFTVTEMTAIAFGLDITVKSMAGDIFKLMGKKTSSDIAFQ